MTLTLTLAFAVALLASPLVPVEYLIVLHLVVGSGRWADLPPNGMGLPLLTAFAVLWNVVSNSLTTDRDTVRGDGAKLDGRRYPTLTALCILGLVCWAVISLFWSPSTPYGLEKVLRLGLLDLLPALAAFVALRRRQADLDRTLGVLRWAALALSSYGILGALVAGGAGVNQRLSIGGTDPIRFGIFGVIGVLLWLLHDPRRSRDWVIKVLGVLICAAAVVGSDSKGPVVAALVAFVVLLVRGRSRVAVARVVTIVLLGILVYLVTPAAYTSRFDPTIYGNAAESESVLLRQQFEVSALNEFASHPIVGGGSGSFNTIPQVAYGEKLPVGGAVVIYPHMLPLEVAAELGLVGLALLVGTVASAWGLLRNRAVTDQVVVVVVVSTVETLFSGDISDARLVWFGLAFAAAQWWLVSDGENQPGRGRAETRGVGGHPGLQRSGGIGALSRVGEGAAGDLRHGP
jgi:O-antigen ligase